jgi:complex iron-sulfur molybdoenzyme family reductase subunit alpha
MKLGRREFLKKTASLAGAFSVITVRKVLALELANLQVVDDPYDYPYTGWESLYRDQWTWDSVVRSTHSQNCTGSCTWWVYVKDGIIMREEQAADYPKINSIIPAYNPRGCQKGGCYSTEYIYGDRRIKYPLIRKPGTGRGEGQWVRATWDEALSYIANKILDTIQNHGPDYVNYFTPIPAMSPVSFASGARFAHLTGGVVMSFYDWYCDLPPGSPITLGEQTDVCESADWYNSRYIILWGSSPIVTRIPDAHFAWEAKYNGTKVVAIYPDYAPSAIHSDQWIPIKPGTDAAFALALCHVLIRDGLYDSSYLKEQTDMPLLVRTDTKRLLRESDIVDGGAENKFYWWCTRDDTLEEAPGTEGSDNKTLSYDANKHDPALTGEYSVTLADGSTVTVKPVFEFIKSKLFSEFSPSDVASITGVDATVIENLASEAGNTALATGGKVMIMHGAGTNHWYHNDLNNRAMLLFLSLLGAIGKNGGGFNHYVGQEKIWPKKGWAKLCFPNGGSRQRFQNTTLWTYVHSEADDSMDSAELQKAGLSQPIRGYIYDSVSNGWMPLYPEGCLGTDKSSYVDTGVPVKDPKVLIVWRGNYFNQAKGNTYLENVLYPKLDLIVNINFQMDTTALYADVVLPAASHYEKYDLNSSDLHSFIHPFTPALTPLFESKTDWQIFAALAQKLQEEAVARGFTSFDDPIWGGTRDLSTLHAQYTDNGALAQDDAAAQFILDNSPETEGMTLDEIATQPKRFNQTTTWTSDVEPGRPYTAFLKMTEAKNPYETITGRQQYYIDHEWFMEFGEELPTYKPLVDADEYPLRYNSPHARWAIHSTWRNAKWMLRLQRGGPVVYMNPNDMQDRNLSDNDWVRVYNDHGEIICRVKRWPSERPGRVTMYHGWERYVGVKLKPRNFNSFTTIRIKPTQLAGGYGQLHFKLNYWGPTGNQRDIKIEIEKYA